MPCNRGHQFLDTSPDQASIVAEWSLVCEREHLLHVLSIAYLSGGRVLLKNSCHFWISGLLVGGLTLGWLADSLGRRAVMLACLYSQVGNTIFFFRISTLRCIQCLLAIGTHWVTRIEVFLAIRAAQGLLVTGLQVVKMYRRDFEKVLQGDHLHPGSRAGWSWLENYGCQRSATRLDWR